MENIIKITVLGTPISKSNFKLSSVNGRYILPNNSGTYHDRYGVYEQHISYEVKRQYPNLVLNTSVTAILNVFYKYEKKHPDTINITKSIFDGIEKSGIIVNDAQITKIYVEEFYDRENPRFELMLLENHLYDVDISVRKKEIPSEKIIYKQSINSQKYSSKFKQKTKIKNENSETKMCYICHNKILNNDYVKISNTNSLLCKTCLKKKI